MLGRDIEFGLNVVRGSRSSGKLNVIEILNICDLILVFVVNEFDILAIVSPTVGTEVDTKTIRVLYWVKERIVVTLEEDEFSAGFAESAKL